MAASPVLDRLGVRYFVTSPAQPLFGDLQVDAGDGGTTALVPGRTVAVPVAPGAALRGLGVTTESTPAVPGSTRIEVVLRAADGSVVARNSRIDIGMTAGQPFVVPFAEPPASAVTADITVDGPEPVTVATRTGVPAVSTVRARDDGLRLVDAETSVIYQRLTALPRIRWASQTVVEPDPQRQVDLVAGGGLRPDQVVLDAPGPAAEPGPATLAVSDDGLDDIDVTVDASADGYLVVADALQVGWTVEVDGRPATLRPADHAARRRVRPRGHARRALGVPVGDRHGRGGDQCPRRAGARGRWRRDPPTERPRPGPARPPLRSAREARSVRSPSTSACARGLVEVMTPDMSPAPDARHPSLVADDSGRLVPFRGDRGQVDVTVVLPCYNEQDHVLDEVERITKALDNSSLSYELLVIDDKSTDDTLAVLRESLPRFPRMRLMPFRRNGGSGTARRIGTAEASGDIVVWTDADMTYPNERIPEFVHYLTVHPDVDQVVGARTSEQGTHRFLRVPAKWVIRRIAEFLSDTRIPDLNSGLRAFRREVALPYLRLLPPGFSCVTTITMSFLSNQHTVDYLPIDYAQRAGTSKFHFVRDAYRYVLQVLRMVMYFNPLKVLMPLALTLLALGVVKGATDLFRYDLRITTNATLLFLTGLIIASVGLLADLIVRSRGDT